MGSNLFVDVETSEHHVLTGDVLVLCSDGLHGSVNDARYRRHRQPHPTISARPRRSWSAIANERDGSDNMSVQLIRVRGVERVGMYRGRPYRLR